MSGSNDDKLKSELKKLIVETCRKKIDPETVPDDAPIIGQGSFLELDSLDVLELSVALKNNYAVRIMDSKDAFIKMKSINCLADTIQPE